MWFRSFFRSWADQAWADQADRDYRRGYVAGRNFVKARPDKIVWSRHETFVGRDAFDFGWDAGVDAGITTYYVKMWEFRP